MAVLANSHLEIRNKATLIVTSRAAAESYVSVGGGGGGGDVLLFCACKAF